MPSADSSLSLFEDLRAFVRAESAASQRERDGLWSMTLEGRVEKGWCVAGLHFEEVTDEGHAVFSWSGNDSRLREGDLVTLSQDKPAAGSRATIFQETDDFILLKAQQGKFVREPFLGNQSGWTLDRAYIDLTAQYLKALEDMMRTQNGRDFVIPLLTGEAEDGVDAEAFEGVHGELTDSGNWEDQQMDAIAACVAAPWHRLVQGPPGTGKTHVLAEVVRRLVEKGERVFLTSLTHRAIDNALNAVARALGDRSRCARIAVPMHRGPDEFPIHDGFHCCPLAGRSGGYVVAATPFVLASRIKGVDFDSIVIDEAGQVTVPLAVMAMVRARKFLFFGDDCQLGPVVQSLGRREARETGIFQKLQRHDPVRLNVTYRLNETLAFWPSENFYHGDLTPAPPAAHRRLAWQAPADLDPWIAQVLDPAQPLTWLAVKHHGALTTSPEEAEAAAEVLEALAAGGVRHGEIAVVVPFRRQARRLRRRLRGDAWRQVVIDTVERMQGQEREVVLLSLTSSDLPFLQRIGDFFFDPRRLNVAATRGRSKLVIVASPDLLKFSTFDTDLAEDAAVLHSLLREAVRIDYPHTVSHE